jgi:hypothetical protein
MFLLNCEQSSRKNLFEWSQFKRNRRNSSHFAEKKRPWNQAFTKQSKLQKKAARVITGASYDVRSNEIFRKLDWMPIHKSLSIRENIVTFKALTANSPNYLPEMFNFRSNETYNLRSNFCQLSLDKPNTNFLKKSFSYRAAKSWNNLPDNIRHNVDNITVNVAKSMLINHHRTD